MSPKPPKPTEHLTVLLAAATKRVAPVWPLESIVAVNPYHMMVNEDFSSVAGRLRAVAGAKMTMPTSFYLEALAAGRMAESDVADALAEAGRPEAASDFLAAARGAIETGPRGSATGAEGVPRFSVPTVADVAGPLVGLDLDRLVVDRVSAFAGAYFDDCQAAWRPAAPKADLFGAWRAEAELDRTPEILGLPGFRAAVQRLPAAHLAASAEALRVLDVPSAGLELYLHRLLLRVGGWAAYAGRIVWDRGLYDGEEDDSLLQFLSVLLAWEAAMLSCLGGEIQEAWARTKVELAKTELALPTDLERTLVLQAAFERAARRRIEAIFDGRASPPKRGRTPLAQAVFCIDVRSEVYRRHLEATDSDIETLGFAGFFGFAVEHVPLAHEAGKTHCPVLLTPAVKVSEGLENDAEEARAVGARRLTHEVKRAWQAFKMGAISCFSFVGPVGLAYLPKLFTDGFGWTRPVPHPDAEGLAAASRKRDVHLEPGHRGGLSSGIPFEQRVELAAGALTAMSLTDGFSRWVLITGHGSNTVNNPHATALDCGACGGRTGEPNVRVAAKILNDPEVRAKLLERGIEIPAHTIFLACQHDTTTDEIEIFNRSVVPAERTHELAGIEATLSQASRAARMERARRLRPGKDVHRDVLFRSRDWAQVRPEWGLAGCSLFVAAPRHRTQTLDLGGRSFLHSYAWQQDSGFSVLELIMTAPVVVASWISYQYYASTVDNELFGCGNKTLHNVVGGVGVLEGNAGDLRVGLPWQSVHDGESLQHEPLRLTGLIEAPLGAMNAIIVRHELVRNLLDNRWLHLYAIGEDGDLSHEYAGSLEWKRVGRSKSTERRPLASV